MISQSEFCICMSSTSASPLPHSPDLWLISSFLWFASNPSLTLAPLFFLNFDPCLVKSALLLLFKYGEANRSKEDFPCKQSLLLKDPERRGHITLCRATWQKHQGWLGGRGCKGKMWVRAYIVVSLGNRQDRATMFWIG